MEWWAKGCSSVVEPSEWIGLDYGLDTWDERRGFFSQQSIITSTLLYFLSHCIGFSSLYLLVALLCFALVFFPLFLSLQTPNNTV